MFLVNYCLTTKQYHEGLMLLCEVTLGKMYESYKAITLSASTLLSGTHSTKGCGSTIPDPKSLFHCFFPNWIKEIFILNRISLYKW